ncbi:MAG: hypothetical protein ACR2H5_13240 [Ktedonobacteraceae bacterium]
MSTLPCWCVRGMCHTCQQQRYHLYYCQGCQHWFCLCCAHCLGTEWACISCATTWMNVMCSLAMPPSVERWVNNLPFAESS